MRGPCARPESVEVIPARDPEGPPALVTNFGLLLVRPAVAGLELLCEETFGGRVSRRVRRSPSGALLAPGLDGFYRSGVACGFARASGSVFAMGEMVDVATVPGDAEAVWALGVLPPVLHRSRDGGFTFEAAFSFPGGFRPQRVYVAPADPMIVVVAGYEAAFPLVLARSQDAGRTFEILRFEEAVFGRPGTATELLGLDPSRPTGDRLLLAAGSPSGSDEIFLSEDGGRSWSKVLTLSGMEVKSGFAVADDGQSVYLAGRAVFDRPGEAAAHLYRSNDGGRSFPDILASGEQGPHFNCLALAGARLFACGDEDKDGFLFAASTDQGRTWSDRVRLTDIVGPPGCVGDTCLATALWLCEAYGVCSPGLSRDGGTFPGATDGPGDGTFEGDGSCSDGAPCPASTGDCGCRIPGAPGGRPAGPALLFGLGAAALWGSRRRRRRFGPVPRARKEKAR